MSTRPGYKGANHYLAPAQCCHARMEVQRLIAISCELLREMRNLDLYVKPPMFSKVSINKLKNNNVVRIVR